MEDLYRTPTRNGGRVLDQDEVTVFHTPSKGIVDSGRHQWKNPSSSATGLPSSNRDNVIDALKNIQDRIRALEMERTTAEENLRDLSKETQHYRQSLDRLRAQSPAAVSDSSYRQDKDRSRHVPPSPARSHTSTRTARRHDGDMGEQLRAADARCALLDKQLEYMRSMLTEAENEKRLAYERSDQMIKLRNANTAQDMRTQMDKISEMEREHHKLQVSQAVAQERIKELERALEHTRRIHYEEQVVPDNLSSELKSAAQSNKILIEKMSPPTSPKKDSTRRKKSANSRRSAPNSHPKPGQHYRLNLNDIPFVVGQSTTPSHRLGSNVQNVIAMMKNHNKELCAAAGQRHRPRSAPGSRRHKRKEKIVVTSTGEESESDTEIQDIIDQLNVDYTHMAVEHHELTRQMDVATNRSVAADLQHEIEKLEIRMATKAEQIATLSRKSRERKQRPDSTTSSSSKSRAARNAYNVPSSSTTGEVEVTTTIKTRGKHASNIIDGRPRSRNENLNTLNTLKTLKTRLKPDDLRWTT